MSFEDLHPGQSVQGQPYHPTRESIRDFCDASLDYNPLHLDDEYMKGDFGKTNFGGIIMHGMNNFGVISKMLTDWLYPMGGQQRRLETRWKKPVRPGDTISPQAVIREIKATARSRWVRLDVQVLNQLNEIVATGEALAEFPQGDPT
ncbi:MAG: MaoC family dehydratase [Betaproteobacteria bacterium]